MRACFCALVLLVVGCGELVDDSYRGEVVRTIEALATSEVGPDLTVQFNNTRVALFWTSAPLTDPFETTSLVEQPGTSVELERSGEFRLEIRATPSEAFWITHGDRSIAVGRLAAYEDANGNQLRDDDEPFVGTSRGRGLIYVPEAIPTGPLFPRSLTPGLHEVLTPLLCGPPRPVPDSGALCDVPIGASCEPNVPSACGDGVCLNRQLTPTPWPDGYCAIAVPRGDPVDCNPGAARWFSGSSLETPDVEPQDYLIAECDRDEDCDRGDAYVCDPWLGACVAALRTDVILDVEQVAPFCAMRPSGMPGMMPPRP